jgi:hypothetical protein
MTNFWALFIAKASPVHAPSDRQQMGPTTWVNAYNDLHCKRQFSKR